MQLREKRNFFTRGNFSDVFINSKSSKQNSSYLKNKKRVCSENITERGNQYDKNLKMFAQVIFQFGLNECAVVEAEMCVIIQCIIVQSKIVGIGSEIVMID